jgi:hypothetical protein
MSFVKKTIPLSLCIFAILSTTNGQIPANLTDGLMAYYGFKGNFDDSAGANNLINIGATFTNDRFGVADGAISVNEANYLVSEYNIGISGNSSRTVSLWAFVNTAPVFPSGRIVTWGDNNPSQAFWLMTSGQEIFADYSFQVTSVLAPQPSLIGTWNHLVYTYDGSLDSVRFYVNGELYESGISDLLGTGIIDTLDTQLYINADIPDNPNQKGVSGSISDLAIYNRALSSSEVAELYQAQSPTGDLDNDGVINYRELIDGTDPNDPTSFNPLSIGLIAHFPFEGNANDESGYNREAQTGDIAQSVSTLDDLRPSFDFGGGSNSYSIVTGIPIPTNNAYSWSVWIKPEVLKPRNFLLSRIDRIDGDSSPWIEVDGGGKIRFARSNEPGLRHELLSEDGEIQVGFWNHVVAVSHSNGRRQLFVNGLPVAEGMDLIYGEEHPLLLIGADRYLSGHPTHAPGANANFQGKISSVRVYDRAISPIEAAQLYINDMACMTMPNSGLTVAADFLTSFGLQRYSSGTADVTENPNAFGLFTERQFEDNRTAGRLDVIISPMTFGLYDGDSIMDLRMGGLMVQKQGSNAVVSFQPQTTTDLATQPFTNNGTAITNEIPMPGDKGFIRIQANPAPTPTPQQ